MGAAMFDARRCLLAAVPFLNDLASQARDPIELLLWAFMERSFVPEPRRLPLFFQGGGPEAVTGRQDETMP